MPSRPDIRELASNVKDAFADADRDTLLDVLTFVIKEYVVEGPPPMLIHQAETLADLRAPSFAQLVTALQTRFDHPELAMFVVDGETVSVRIGNAVHPLLPSRLPVGGTAAELPRPQVGVNIVETTLAPRPAPAAAAQPAPARPGTAPPPRAGVSVRSQPGGTGGDRTGMPAPMGPGIAPQPPAPPPPAAQPPAAPQAAAPQPSDKPEPSGDDASARFSLLELD
jgi:hypothetical protein